MGLPFVGVASVYPMALHPPKSKGFIATLSIFRLGPICSIDTIVEHLMWPHETWKAIIYVSYAPIPIVFQAAVFGLEQRVNHESNLYGERNNRRSLYQRNDVREYG